MDGAWKTITASTCPVLIEDRGRTIHLWTDGAYWSFAPSARSAWVATVSVPIGNALESSRDGISIVSVFGRTLTANAVCDLALNKKQGFLLKSVDFWHPNTWPTLMTRDVKPTRPTQGDADAQNGSD